MRLSPPDETVEVKTEKLEELAGYLKEIIIYERDDSYMDYVDQAAVFTMVMSDGSKIEVIGYNPFMVINGVGYKTKYEPCEALNCYASRLLEESK